MGKAVADRVALGLGTVWLDAGYLLQSLNRDRLISIGLAVRRPVPAEDTLLRLLTHYYQPSILRVVTEHTTRYASTPPTGGRCIKLSAAAP